jgi:hypothetical protein
MSTSETLKIEATETVPSAVSVALEKKDTNADSIDVTAALQDFRTAFEKVQIAVDAAIAIQDRLEHQSLVRALIERVVGMPLPDSVNKVELYDDYCDGVMSLTFNDCEFMWDTSRMEELTDGCDIPHELAEYGRRLMKNSEHPDLVAWLQATRARFSAWDGVSE